MKHACFLPLLCLTVYAHADEVCVSPNASIPDNSVSGLTIPIDVVAGDSEVIESIMLELEADHPWVGDLVITLKSPSGATITLLDRPGIPSAGFPGPFGCGGRDIDALFSDGAGTNAEDLCSYAARPVITGAVLPSEALGTLSGEPANGVWNITIADHSAYDTGELIRICLSTTTTIVCLADLNGDGELNFFDVSAFLGAFTAQDPLADFTGDGQFNFFDVSTFLNAFSAGCP